MTKESSEKNQELPLSQQQKLRKLALDTFLATDHLKREEIGRVEFVVPKDLDEFTRQDAQQVADAIHPFRFLGKENTPEAQQARKNYYVIVLEEKVGDQVVFLFFSRQAWAEKKRALEKEIARLVLAEKLGGMTVN